MKMADRNKFEEMLERLINEDKAGAEELFHEIVVEKSRDIYAGILENDLEEVTDEEVDEATDEEVDEASDEEVDESDEDLDENFDLEEFEVEADPMGGDAADDMMGDIEASMDDDEEGEDDGEDAPEGDVEDRVEDLEDALDDLKAEFEKMMAGDDSEEGSDDEADSDMGDEEGEEEADESQYFGEADKDEDEEVEEATEEDEVEESKEPKNDIETMKEYVEKVTATMGDNGANTKSTLAGANDMGGEAGNIAQGADEKGRKADSAKDMSTGNVNVPGGKASKSMKAQPKGHGAEKKGAGETADNKKSMIGK